MQENNTRLIDEALGSEPVKNTFRLAWEFVSLNPKFILTVMGIFIVLNILGSLPVLSLVFMVMAGTFGISFQIYVGRTFYGTQDIESYVKEIKESRIDEMLTRHLGAAFGSYIGFILLLILFSFIVAIMLNSSGLVGQNMSEADVLMALSGVRVPLLLLLLIFFYLQPLVHSNIILSNTFGEGFKAVFTIFSRDIWSSSFQKSYFSYISILGLAIFVVVLVLASIVNVLMVVGLLAKIVLLSGIIILMAIMSVAGMMSRRIVEK